jgi:DNA modification methylase
MSAKTTGRQMSFASTVPKASKSSMSDDYYSGDKPNPNIRAFVEQHLKEKPYDPATDKYDVPAFNKPIETTKATAIYNMHTYWSKKPHDAIRQYIRHYTQPGDLVLDPFCGSGGTALAALMDGRKAVAIDRSPAATFITKNYCTPVDPNELREAFEQVKAKVKDEIDWLYETKCDRCGGKATTAYTVYSQVFQCPRCLEKVPLFDCVEVDGATAAGKPKKVNVCPHCHKRGHEEEIGTRLDGVGFMPVSFGYECESRDCRPRRSNRRVGQCSKSQQCELEADLAKLRQIEEQDIPHRVPAEQMMHVSKGQRWGLLWRPYLKDVSYVRDFFTKRNLWAVLAIRDAIGSLANVDHATRDFLLGGVTAILFKASRMMGYREDGIGRVMTGTYWLPPLSKDINVWWYFDEWYSDAERHIAQKSASIDAGCLHNVVISTDNATTLREIASGSIDYVFTDPPYSWKVQYGESNFLWESFLELDTRWHDDEIIVNEFRGKAESDWAQGMRHAMAECYRVLKPGRWLSLCYHDTSEGTWALIQDIMAEAGFIADQGGSALFIDADQKSIKQITADKINRRDLVINFRKPKAGEFRVTRLVIPENADVQTFRELARQVIRDYLQSNPGSTKDRVYDELVSRMVRAGTMQAHNFDELLREVAEEAAVPGGGSSRWYLKEAEETQLDASEQQAEDRAAAVMEKFIAKKSDEASAEGVHYSDLFEHYLYAVKDKPRRPLADWLADYFFKTEDGTWRLPAGEEERELKEKSRASGANRRIKRYANMLSAGVTIPANKIPTSQTLSEWIRHAKRTGLYEAGKLLYERGGLDLDKLGEEQQVEVQEDYETCVRALQRAAGGEVGEKKRKRKKKE